MRAIFIHLAVLLLFPLAAFAGKPKEFQYGPRPPLSVFDPEETLDPKAIKDISAPLTSIHQKEGVDVIAVILKDLGNAPPEHVAELFADAWCDSDIHCIVLHVPGREDSPWIIPGGKLIDYVTPAQMDRAVETVRRHAVSEPTDTDKVRTAAGETSDMLRYWLATAKNHNDLIRTESWKIRMEQRRLARNWRLAALGAVASAIPLIIGIAFLIGWLRKRGPAYFPSHTWQPRLGAPHGGGNDVLIAIGKPPSDSP